MLALANYCIGRCRYNTAAIASEGSARPDVDHGRAASAGLPLGHRSFHAGREAETFGGGGNSQATGPADMGCQQKRPLRRGGSQQRAPGQPSLHRIGAITAAAVGPENLYGVVQRVCREESAFATPSQLDADHARRMARERKQPEPRCQLFMSLHEQRVRPCENWVDAIGQSGSRKFGTGQHVAGSVERRHPTRHPEAGYSNRRDPHEDAC